MCVEYLAFQFRDEVIWQGGQRISLPYVHNWEDLLKSIISAFGLLVLDVKHWTGNRIDFASVSTDLLPHEADIGDRECREGQGQQTDQVGPDKQQTLSQRQIAAQCADQLCV